MKIMFWKENKIANCHWTSSGLQSTIAFFTSGNLIICNSFKGFESCNLSFSNEKMRKVYSFSFYF